MNHSSYACEYHVRTLLPQIFINAYPVPGTWPGARRKTHILALHPVEETGS